MYTSRVVTAHRPSSRSLLRESICYHECMDVETLERETRAADAAARSARARLVTAVRQASASGMSQREIAAHSNRSQPEIRRLLKFHGTTPNGRRLRANRDTLVALLAASGLHNVRVFGSTARDADRPDSDIDLLVSADAPLGLFAQAQVGARGVRTTRPARRPRVRRCDPPRPARADHERRGATVSRTQ